METLLRAILVVSLGGIAFAETYRFEPKEFYNTFSGAHKPVLTIKPGDHVITSTLDAGGVDSAGVKRAQGPNPETGPFYSEPKTLIWQLDKKMGVARLESADFKPGRLELPLRPMLGCVGTAPPGKAAIPTSTPDSFGGNMDYNGMNAGVTLMLPVSEPGALFFLGDGHARQGDGEVTGGAIETSLDVEFSVELRKGKKITWPRMENEDYIMVLGSSRSFVEALQHANTEMQRWLMTDYGFDERGSSLLMGQAMESEIANVVDPEFTIVAKMRKRYLKSQQ
jgi:amidase